MSEPVFVPPVRRVDGGWTLGIEREERDLLARLLGELRDLILSDDGDDPLLARLFPPAYPDDEEKEAEYQRLMREELVASRLAAIETVRELMEPGAPEILDEEQLTSFMQSLNAVRLVLGSMLGITEDDDPDDDAAISPEHQLYAFLSWILEWTVRSLSGT